MWDTSVKTKVEELNVAIDRAMLNTQHERDVLYLLDDVIAVCQDTQNDYRAFLEDFGHMLGSNFQYFDLRNAIYNYTENSFADEGPDLRPSIQKHAQDLKVVLSAKLDKEAHKLDIAINEAIEEIEPLIYKEIMNKTSGVKITDRGAIIEEVLTNAFEDLGVEKFKLDHTKDNLNIQVQKLAEDIVKDMATYKNSSSHKIGDKILKLLDKLPNTNLAATQDTEQEFKFANKFSKAAHDSFESRIKSETEYHREGRQL